MHDHKSPRRCRGIDGMVVVAEEYHSHVIFDVFLVLIFQGQCAVIRR